MMTNPSEPPSNVIALRGEEVLEQRHVALPGMRAAVRPKSIAVKSTTPTIVATAGGDTAQTIIANFTAYLAEATEVRLPQPLVARLAKQVRVLILDKYERTTIVWSLAIWAHRASTATIPPPPESLVSIAWKYAMDGSQAAARWRDQMKTAIRVHQNERAGGADVAPDVAETKSETRRRRTAHGGAAWLQRQEPTR